MRRLRIATCLWIIAAMSLPLAVFAQVRASRIYRATRWIAIGPTLATNGLKPVGYPEAISTLGSARLLTFATSASAVAGISGLRGSADPAGLLANRLSFAIRPGTSLVGVTVEWETAAEASAIVDAVVAASPYGTGRSPAGPPVVVAHPRPAAWLPAAGLVSLAYLLLAVAALVVWCWRLNGVTTRRPITA